MLDVVREAAGAAAVLLAARRRDPVGAYVLGRTAAGACALLFSYRRLATATISSKSRWPRSAATETSPRDSEMKVRIDAFSAATSSSWHFAGVRASRPTVESKHAARAWDIASCCAPSSCVGGPCRARLGSATSSTRRAQLLRTRTDAGTVDWPKSQVESCSRPVFIFWPEAKVRPGTTSAPAKIRVDGPVRKSVPNYSSVSSSLAPNFTPDVPRSCSYSCQSSASCN